MKFSPYAWAKLVFMRDMTENEVGCFGITSKDDLLLIEDIVVVKQKVSPVTVSFEDESVADLFEDQVILGRQPEQFARHWIHTHPGSSPEPSGTDEATFHRVFGSCDWSIMFILAQNGNSYARLRFTSGPGGYIEISVCVDYSIEFDKSDFTSWKAEYKDNVTEDKMLIEMPHGKDETTAFGYDGTEESYEDMIEQLDEMDPYERQAFLDELAVRNEFWDESEVLYE